MDRTHLGMSTLIVALVLGGCSSIEPAATAVPPTTGAIAASLSGPSPRPPTVVIETPVPDPSTTPAPAATARPSPTPTKPPRPKAGATPTQTPKPAAGWTAPHQVGKATDCVTVTAAIDAESHYHVVAECGGTIRYSVSTDAGHSWTSRAFAHAPHREEIDPRIAVDGNVLYVAYTRIIPDGGCGGGRGPNVGVYVRSRVLPGGLWSKAKRIGSAADALEAFQVDRGIVHATVKDGQGLSYYVTLEATAYRRYPISDSSIGTTSMRVGSDGRARIVFAAGRGIRYATFTGAGFSTKTIPGTTEQDRSPVLALDSSDHARIVWTRYEPATCGDSPVGTYYASNASGSWKVQRITKDVGDTSVQVNGATGRVRVLVGSDAGLRYYTKASGGSWKRTTLASTSWAASPALRRDPTTGAMLVVYIDRLGSSSPISVVTTK
jgi:hypothetical protein